MKLEFSNIIPKPLENEIFSKDSIWGNSICIDHSQKVLLNASSGKGKSTFSAIVYGLRNDYSGKLLYDEVEASTLTKEDWTNYRRTKLSIVFQDLQLFPTLTVKENLLIKNELTNTYTENQIHSFVGMLDLESKWDVQMQYLSYGQQQRIAIIRSLLQPFEWLFLDEPFSHLDEGNTKKCLDLILDETENRKAGFILTSLGSKHGYNFDVELKL
jgi:putative ABC transport system ATP-binding protein